MENKSNGLGIASMVIGIIALLLSCCYGGVLGIVGLILGIVGLTKPGKKGTAIAGVVTSSISILILLVLILIYGNASGVSVLSDYIEKSEDAQTSSNLDITTEDMDFSNSLEPSTEDQNHSEETEITMNMNLAIEAAKDYMNSSRHYTYIALIDQLENDQYTHDEAVFAAEHCGIDWNEEALAVAIDYLEYSPYSYSGLLQQVKHEKFTHEQAVYAVDHCGADWNEQALRFANILVESNPLSQEELISELEELGFTHEQAVYGASRVGF